MVWRSESLGFLDAEDFDMQYFFNKKLSLVLCLISAARTEVFVSTALHALMRYPAGHQRRTCRCFCGDIDGA
jgi:hypothetical protein